MNHAQQTELFVEKIPNPHAGTFDMFSMYLGVRLGYYKAMSEGGSINSTELATRTKTNERYTRKWLEQQAVGRFSTVRRRICRQQRPPLHASGSLPGSHGGSGQSQLLSARFRSFLPSPAPASSAYRSVPERTGRCVQRIRSRMHEGQAGMNPALFLKEIGSAWFPSIPDVHERLLEEPGAEVADIGTGAAGRASPSPRATESSGRRLRLR